MIAAWAILAAIVACGGSGAEEDEESQARSEALRELEAHLSTGQTYGEGPDGQEIAAAVRETVAPGDGVAVRVIPGQPRHVVVLVQYRADGNYQNLREIEQSERNAEINRIVNAIDHGYGAQQDVLGVAIRGAIFYGALGVRQPGAPMQYHTGSVVSLSPLDPVLTATPGEDVVAPPISLGTQVEGTVGGLDALTSYRLEITEPTTLVTQFVTPERDDNMPSLIVCAGAHRPLACGDDWLEEVSGFYNDGLDDLAERLSARGMDMNYDAYRVEPGVYTLAVLPNCDFDEPCSTVGRSFTLLATSPSRATQEE